MKIHRSVTGVIERQEQRLDTENTAIYLNEYALGGQITAEHFSVHERPPPPVPAVAY